MGPRPTDSFIPPEAVFSPPVLVAELGCAQRGRRSSDALLPVVAPGKGGGCRGQPLFVLVCGFCLCWASVGVLGGSHGWSSEPRCSWPPAFRERLKVKLDVFSLMPKVASSFLGLFQVFRGTLQWCFLEGFDLLFSQRFYVKKSA